MSINYNEIRYRGDAQDVKELFETYRIENYLETFEENLKRVSLGYREKLLKDGIKLNERVSPRIYSIFQQVCSRLEIDTTKEIYCLPATDINAFAYLDIQEAGSYSLVGITAGALEKLDDNEIEFLLGHELGHFLFGNNRLNALLKEDENSPELTVLPPLGESLFLRWRKKAEISADRIGLLASNDFNSSASALMKSTFGLSEKNLNLDIDCLLNQLDEIKGHPELISEAFASHPLLPIRLKALELFSRSKKAFRNGFLFNGEHLDDETLEKSVDNLMLLTNRYPYKPVDEAVMKIIALGGALVLSVDGDIGNEEVKILIQILHYWFTDEPEKEIITNRKHIIELLPKWIEQLNKKADESDKKFILSRLADIALADGALLDAEGSVIMEIAKLMNISERIAYNIIVGAAQSVGFRTDIKLNRIANELRSSLQIGFKP